MFSNLSASPLFSSPRNTAIFMVVVFSLMHLFTMGQTALTNDEAQYALYGYYPAWSYFDHPPLAGWLNAVILQFSDSEFALRLWPLIFAALTSFLIYGFSKELFPAESKWLPTIAVLLYQLSLISQAFALAMLPDTPLIPVALASAWLLLRALKNNEHHLWPFVGILFGLAGLSKYTAVTLVISALLALFIYKSQRVLLTFWPWLAMILAAIVITPVIYWNAMNDWISIAYQLNHGAPEGTPWLFKKFITAQVSQFLTYTPFMYLFGLLAMFKVISDSFKGQHNQADQYLLAFALPVLFLFDSMSGYFAALPHWPALGWIVLTPLVAKWVIQRWQKRTIRVFSYINLGYAFTLIIGFHLALATTLVPFEDNKHPLEDLYGWQDVAAKAVKYHKLMLQEDASSEIKPVIFTGNWAQFARLAWYAKPSPVQVTDQRYEQSDIWYGSATVGGNGILVVPPKYKNSDANGIQRFNRCEFQENVESRINNKVAATYQLYKCYGFKG